MTPFRGLLFQIFRWRAESVNCQQTCGCCSRGSTFSCGSVLSRLLFSVSPFAYALANRRRPKERKHGLTVATGALEHFSYYGVLFRGAMCGFFLIKSRVYTIS